VEPAKIDGVITWSGTNLTMSLPALRVQGLDGMEPDVAVLAKSDPGGAAVVTSRTFGKGRVIAVHADLPELLSLPETRTPALDFLSRLILLGTTPAVRVEGGLQMVGALKKGSWCPCTCRAANRGERRENVFLSGPRTSLY